MSYEAIGDERCLCEGSGEGANGSTCMFCGGTGVYTSPGYDYMAAGFGVIIPTMNEPNNE